MKGENLLSIKADAMSNGNDILTATFQTRALKVSLRITNSTLCSPSLLPSASIHMKDITETSLTVNNLDLKNCYQGDVYADFTIVRGIKVSAGVWTHVRKEYLKDVRIGSIGCHSSCRHCTGPNSNQCLLCADSNMVIHDGICLSTCPSPAPYITTNSIVYQQLSVSYKY